jgi:hypothetical protein
MDMLVSYENAKKAQSSESGSRIGRDSIVFLATTEAIDIISLWPQKQRGERT